MLSLSLKYLQLVYVCFISYRNRSKFVNAARKLHHCHNDYALSIVNVNIHQEFYRRTLLPFTLDTLQERMEMQISDWYEERQREREREGKGGRE